MWEVNNYFSKETTTILLYKVKSREKWYQFRGTQLLSLRLFKKQSHWYSPLHIFTASISLAPLISVPVTERLSNYTSKVLSTMRKKENPLKDILMSEFQIILYAVI